MKKPLRKPLQLFSSSIDRNLRIKVTLGITIPMILMLGIFTVIEYSHHRSILLQNLTRMASYNGEVINESLQHSMLVSDFAEIQRILDAIGNDGDFRVISLLDTSGRVIFAPNGVGVNTRLDNKNASCQACHKLPAASRPSGVVVSEIDGPNVFRSMQPIYNKPECTQCHDRGQKILGLILTDISVEPFESAFIADLRENLILGISTIIISAIFANFIMERLVIRRIKKVAYALTSFGGANSVPALNLDSADEIGQLETNFNEMQRRIQSKESENDTLSEHLRHQTNQRQLLLKRLISVQEEERKRVARELHDELGQSLSGLALHSEAIEKLIHIDPKRAGEQLAFSRELIGRTTQQMYELIFALRPSVLDDLGLVPALKAHAGRVLNGVDFSIDASGLSRRLSPEVETTLYRIYQEGISNVIRHSGASRVAIKLAQRDGVFEGEIADNGKGFNPQDIECEENNPHWLGLLGMKERLSLLGGGLSIISHEGEGTRIQIHVPLAKGKDE